MRVFSRPILREFCQDHGDAQTSLDNWWLFVTKADWNTSHDIKSDYVSASFLSDNKVVFNVGGNKYRLIVTLDYDFQAVYICFVGTHAQYDKVDMATICD